MIHSMTGFGNATTEFGNKTITVEIKSVNSKFFDLSLRLPSAYKDKDLELRSELSRMIERGKADVIVTIESHEISKTAVINKDVVASYYKELKSIGDDLGIRDTDYLGLILRMPDVLIQEKAAGEDAEWNAVMKTIGEAKDNFQKFRKNEGNAIGKDFKVRIQQIEMLLKKIEELEPQRLTSIRKKITGNLEEFIQANNIDRNRLEQELIYYIERLDIAEEKTRLRSHCSYFIKTMDEDSANGKKLSFITQEIGREINTIGSKANDAGIQKFVVEMKDELEKVKEQVLNVL